MQLDRIAAIDGLVTGSAGAATLTLAHEAVRQLVRRAPRIDLLGMSALARGLRAAGIRPPRGERLRGYALVADLVANAIYYAPLAASRRLTLTKGALVGGIAGIGAVVLPPLLGLPKRHRGRGLRAQAITVGLYVAGGIAAAAMGSLLRKRQEHEGEGRRLA